jgi:hypothetical protein
VVDADDDLWSRIINNMIRRSQPQSDSETEPAQQLEGPGAAAPVTSEEAAEYLVRLEEEFPADQDEDSDA